jgi:D-alanyl-D-alanine carboxypeptidase/D-alanyl-D-alanine-endopeptidase (penicillin-binding protein 4)
VTRIWTAAAVLVAISGGAATRSLVSTVTVPTPALAAAIALPSSLLAQQLAREVAYARKYSREVGVHIVDLADRREVYGFEPDKTRILASNTKLLTTAAALVELGPDFRFETKFLLRGKIEDGTLDGDVAVIGAGDPNLSGRFSGGDAYAAFRPWAQALLARGIRRVTGQLYLVNGIFEEPWVHPDWPRDQLAAWYEAPIDALSFNDNCVLVRVRPGPKPGSAAVVSTVPKLDYVRFRNTAHTGAGRSGQLVVSRDVASDVVVVSGWVGQSSSGVDVWVAVHDPVAYFAAGVRGALVEEGIEIADRYRYVHAPLEGAWEQIAVHASDLPSTIMVTNKRSQNFYAESLAKLLGWRKTGTGSWESAVSAISAFLVGIGVPASDFRLSDGSGLSRGDQATPRAVTRVLEQMYFHDYGRTFLQSLPYSGERDLVWRQRLATRPYLGNVFAKTGTLRGVSALSGYAKAVSGRVYAFSILLNQVRGNGSAHAVQDRIVRALVDRG